MSKYKQILTKIRLYLLIICSLIPFVIFYFYLQQEYLKERRMLEMEDQHQHYVGLDKKLTLKLPSNLSVFSVGMNSTEKNMLLDIVSTFSSVMKTTNLTYFLYGGSLLGALRHGGIIPWDDDIDVWINNSQSSQFIQVFSKLKEYKLYNPIDSQWKFFSIHGNSVINSPYKWPYLDIYRFNENETHVSDSLHQYQVLFSYQKSDIYPLKTCKFETLELNVPKNIEKIVTTNYDPEVCASAKFNHRIDQPIRSQRQVVPCKILSPYYKFGAYCL